MSDALHIHQAPNETALFQDMILDAEYRAHIALPHELEGHLVFLLLRFLRGGKRLSGALALHYLEAVQAHGSARVNALNDTGDACLLLAGMFPEQARRRMVGAGYFAQMGLACYRTLADCLLPRQAKLYHHLCNGFADMLGVLRSLHHSNIRKAEDNSMDAYELWASTGCAVAYAELREQRRAIPIRNEQQYLM